MMLPVSSALLASENNMIKMMAMEMGDVMSLARNDFAR